MDAAAKLFQEKFYGVEEPPLERHLADILNWYSAMREPEDARAWLTEYLQAAELTDDVEKLQKVPDVWVPCTAGWLARLALRGYELSEHNFDTIHKQLTIAFSHIETFTENPVFVERVVDVQKRLRDKVSDTIAEIEGMIDDKKITPGWSLYDFLRAREISAEVAKRLATHFTPIADELIDAINPEDKCIKEAYKRYSVDQIEEMAIIYQSLLDDALRYTNVAKKTREPRKKKKPSVEKILRHFRYAKINDEYQLASISPEKIIGASELWTFDPQRMLLSVYRANDSDGLKINRTAIVNINEENSMSKRIAKKTQERLQAVLEGGKVALRHLMEDIKGMPKEAKRLNNDTILLRVIS